MSHKFNPVNRNKLDNPRRRELLPPKETLLQMGLKQGDILADIGCGIGYFTIPAAMIVGPEGKVFALDISEELLEETKAVKRQEGLENIETVLVDEYDLKLSSSSISFALVSIVLHEIDNLPRYLNEISRILSPGGQLAIIEWEKRESNDGPPLNRRLDKTELQNLIRDAGFKLGKSWTIREELYVLLAQKI
jgi:ubiquinone/menaquinone biosynthesis C-methylase UbiE